MTTGSRLPAVILLVLGVVAASLLVAGWGVAVGVGFFVGLVLGLINILAAMAITQRIGGSASYSCLHAGSTPTEPDRALLERHGRDSMRVAGIDSGDLQRVIAVGASVEAGSVRLELTSVELRTDGGLATLVAHTRPPMGQAGPFVEVRVKDDAGTSYVAAGQGTGGSGPTTTRHQVRFAPAPPAGAKVLTLSIDRFVDPFPGGATAIEGPWWSEISLGP